MKLELVLRTPTLNPLLGVLSHFFEDDDWTSPIGIRFDTEPIRIQMQTLRLRRSYQILSAASFSVTEELSTNGGPFVRLGTGFYERVRTKLTR